jgi:hypothetical protein
LRERTEKTKKCNATEISKLEPIFDIPPTSSYIFLATFLLLGFPPKDPWNSLHERLASKLQDQQPYVVSTLSSGPRLYLKQVHFKKRKCLLPYSRCTFFSLSLLRSKEKLGSGLPNLQTCTRTRKFSHRPHQVSLLGLGIWSYKGFP